MVKIFFPLEFISFLFLLLTLKLGTAALGKGAIQQANAFRAPSTSSQVMAVLANRPLRLAGKHTPRQLL